MIAGIHNSHAIFEQIKLGRTNVSDLLNWKFVTLECREMHLRAPEQLKMSFKNSSTTTESFDKLHDAVLKLQENWGKKTYFPWFLVVPA